MAPNDADVVVNSMAADADEDLRIEAVNVDHYMSAPLPPGAIPGLLSVPCYLMAREVPVVRIFGATPAGQKALVHLHGVFPYFYFRTENDAVFDDPEELRRLLPRIAMELERANEIKQQSTAKASATRTTSSNRAKIVAKLLIVQGMSFYGYHATPKLFVQVFLYNPRAIASVVQILESGCITERRFQTYESHIPFLLQVFADYNIEGMNYVHLANVKFRAPVPTQQSHLRGAASSPSASQQSLDPTYRVVLRSNTPDSKLSGFQNPSQTVLGRHVTVHPHHSSKAQWFARHSSCALELDVAAANVLNPKLFRSLQQASLEANDALRNVPSLAAIWEEERRRRIRNGESNTPELSLTLERHFGNASPSKASAPASSSSSASLLSQSFFHKKMRDSLDAVLTEMERDVQSRTPPAAINTSTSTSNDTDTSGNTSRLSLDDSSLLLEADASGSSQVATCRNSVATESLFAFSQVGEATGLEPAASQSQHNTSMEDDDIVSILLAMQSVDRPEWQEKVSAVYSQAADHDVQVFDSVTTGVDGHDNGVHVSERHSHDIDHDEVDEEDDNDEDEDEEENQNNEIGDILAASQAVFDSDHMNSNDEDDTNDGDINESKDSRHDADARANTNGGAWWEVAETESQLSTDSFSEVGSARASSSPSSSVASRAQQRMHQVSALKATRPHSRASTMRQNDDSVVLVQDIEDLLPPPPPIQLRAAFDEDSVRIDRSRLSLTPQPKLSKRQIGTAARLRRVPRRTSGRVWLYDRVPPNVDELLASGLESGIDDVQYQPAFFSKSSDVPDKAMVFDGKTFAFAPHDVRHMAPFDPTALVQSAFASEETPTWTTLADLKKAHARRTEHSSRVVRRVRTPARLPPDRQSVCEWLKTTVTAASAHESKPRRKRRLPRDSLSGSTQSTQRVATDATISNVTVLSLEMFAMSRGALLPDPRLDAVRAVCYAVEAQEGPQDAKTTERGVVLWFDDALDNSSSSSSADAARAAQFCLASSSSGVAVRIASSERELLEHVIRLVNDWDPDFVTGFEVQKASIGYLIDRASQLDINLIQALSRLPFTSIDARNPMARPSSDTATGGHDDDGDGEGESIGTMWGVAKASGLWIHGRYVLNLWRMARSEVKLSRYAFEDVLRAVLQRECPIYLPEDLSAWFAAGGAAQWKVLRYVLQRASLNLQILSKMQLITRTSEMARLFGIDFYSVLSRGSQYRVEAVMLRVTKRRNYLLLSPSRTQVAGQAPMECIPLVMEPHSSFYADPVVVLDFQSLYPSLVIAYNLCYSTCLGRLKNGMNPELESAMGVIDYVASPDGMLQCRDAITIAPNGALFCPKSHRHGVLPVILDEILSTRIMVKKAMKQATARGESERLEKIRNARQLALKMISNVTYGYTAAGFSGRMPCAQLADAIVQSGRCTLEAAVRLVESRADWNARVVYGDTDSLFVLLKGRSKTDAFRIGQDIADAVTAANPRPVSLKLEKVYFGCVLVSKKRYVGHKFEHAAQATGVVEAKGIEIVRRDSCGVVQQSMQRSLELLFTTSDLSLVKRSLQQFWRQMLDDKLPLRDFVFAKEVRLGTYSSGSAPPAALVGTKAMARDPRAEPRYAERVAYVVVNGPPGARLVDLVVSPDEFVRSKPSLSINHQYYIHKQMLPSLERLFLLMGVNVCAWYSDLPKSAVKARQQLHTMQPTRRLAGTTRSIDLFYMSKHCRLCGAIGMDSLCANCTANPQHSLFALHVASARQERALQTLQAACYECGDRASADTCANLTCSIWNRLRIVHAEKVTL